MRAFGFGLRLPAFPTLHFLPERIQIRMEPQSDAAIGGIAADAAWRRREETHPLIDWGRTTKGEDDLYHRNNRKRMRPPEAFSGAVI